MNKTTLIIALQILLFIACGLLYHQWQENGSEGSGMRPDTIIRYDTTYITNDTTIYKPIPRIIEVIRRDTITKDTVLNFEKKEYKDTITTCAKDTILLQTSISGYKASLDSMKVQLKKQDVIKYVEITKHIKEKQSKIGIGLQVGYGLGFKDKAFQPYVGVGIQYRFR